jgi:hypothetical protein
MPSLAKAKEEWSTNAGHDVLVLPELSALFSEQMHSESTKSSP